MTWFMFVDESGHDGVAPYAVLAGIAVEDRYLWPFIQAIHRAESAFFGDRISRGLLELKGKELLKAKTFKFATQMGAIEPDRRRELALSCLRKGEAARRANAPQSGATRADLTGLGQAKIAFVEHLLGLCSRFSVRAFASIVDKDAPRPIGEFLRKDYSYLFERYFYFLDAPRIASTGVVVFDELERSQCHVLVQILQGYS